MIRLPGAVLEAMRDHARRDYPHECCGVLFGVAVNGEKRVSEIMPVSNSREEERKRDRFLITPEEVLRGELYARRSKQDILGYYHSHPDHPAVPSAYDLEHAWPVYSYVIIAVALGVPREVASWVLAPDRSAFRREETTSHARGDCPCQPA